MNSFNPSSRPFTRRGFLGLTSSAAAIALGSRATDARILHVRTSASLSRAYAFLYEMMDRYFRGSTLRLIQSYVSTHALQLGDIGYTYDNALVAIALLQRGVAADLQRATVLGDSLLYAQAHDPANDGRVRDGYHVDPFLKPDGSINIAYSDGDGGSDCGNLAWTGLALAHLYAATKHTPYLNSALMLGTWIQNNAYDTRGAGGYTGGLMQNQSHIRYKSTEHNIDLFAFFTMLAGFTGDSSWTARAAHAWTFVDAMWNGSHSFFWVGTLDDGMTINKSFIPEDVQSWSYLAAENSAYGASLDWAYANLYVNAKPFIGVSFSKSDLSGVWFEGTAHMAAAFFARNGSGDAQKAAAFLSSIALAQTRAPNHDGEGIVAASKDGLRTGDGDKYFAALHIGATSWYCLAAQSANPLRL